MRPRKLAARLCTRMRASDVLGNRCVRMLSNNLQDDLLENLLLPCAQSKLHVRVGEKRVLGEVIHIDAASLEGLVALGDGRRQMEPSKVKPSKVKLDRDGVRRKRGLQLEQALNLQLPPSA